MLHTVLARTVSRVISSTHVEIFCYHGTLHRYDDPTKKYMENVFASMQKYSTFSWEGLDDIKAGRGNFGEELFVLVYRLMQHTLLDVLSKDIGDEKTKHYACEANYQAGVEYAKNVLDLSEDLDTFMVTLQKSLTTLKIGNMRVEELNAETGDIAITVSEGQDCSESFVAGILDTYTGKGFHEVDCWASGERTCRFTTNLLDKEI